jgi:hypothetical protein
MCITVKTSRIDIIGQNGNEGEHYMIKFCKDCKFFKPKTFTTQSLFGKSHIHELPLEVGVCTNEQQELPLKYCVTGNVEDMSYATVARLTCKGDWYV